MTEFVFQRQMQRLKDAYKGVYTTEREKLFWEVLQVLPDHAFMKWVDQKILDSRNAPMGEDIRLLVKSHEKNLFEKEVSSLSLKRITDMPEDSWKTHNYSCLKCRDEGLLLATHKYKNIIATAFVCDCPQGEASHWAQIKKIKDEPPFRIKRWKEQSEETKEQYNVG